MDLEDYRDPCQTLNDLVDVLQQVNSLLLLSTNHVMLV